MAHKPEPFSISSKLRDHLTALTSAQYKRLEAKILREGPLPGSLIVADILGKGRFLLDGHNTYRICKAHGLKTPRPRVLKFDSYEEALDWIEEHQDCRRNESAEVLERRREARDERIRKRLEEGATLREAAAEEGVSKDTAARAATHKEGSIRVSRETKGTKPPLNPDNKNDTSTPKDNFGNEVPPRCRDAWGDPLIQEIHDTIALCMDKLLSKKLGARLAKKGKHFPFLNIKDCGEGIDMMVQYGDDVLNHLKENRPAGVCPKCEGKGCSACRSAGLVPENVYKKLVKK